MISSMPFILSSFAFPIIWAWLYLYHSDLFCQIWSDWDFKGYNGKKWVSTIPPDFFGLMISGKIKKAIEGRKGQAKTKGWNFYKFYNSFVPLASFGVNYCHVSLFSTFKVEKVKKAAIVAKNTKLQTGKSADSKILL